jgi:hypothetical protein
MFPYLPEIAGKRKRRNGFLEGAGADRLISRERTPSRGNPGHRGRTGVLGWRPQSLILDSYHWVGEPIPATPLLVPAPGA